MESTESTRCDLGNSVTSQMKSDTGTLWPGCGGLPMAKKGFFPLTGLAACKQIC
jgi:hypothetical protein